LAPRCTLFPYTTLFRSSLIERASRPLSLEQRVRLAGSMLVAVLVIPRVLTGLTVPFTNMVSRTAWWGLLLFAAAVTKSRSPHHRSEEHTSELQSPCNLV